MNVDAITNDVVSHNRPFRVDGPALYTTATGEPCGETTAVVIATVIVLQTALAIHGASEFTGPDDERILPACRAVSDRG